MSSYSEISKNFRPEHGGSLRRRRKITSAAMLGLTSAMMTPWLFGA